MPASTRTTRPYGIRSPDHASASISMHHVHGHTQKDYGAESIHLDPPAADFAQSPSVQADFPTASDGLYKAHTADKCYCGHQCACPDCALHRGIGSSTGVGASGKGHEGPCRECVDHEGGVEMPGHKPKSSILDQFFARAASLPVPPSGGRARNGNLDPMNVTVLPPNLITRSKSAFDSEIERAFGLINIPKLECCGGRCSCPKSKCECGEDCGGCCVDDGKSHDPLVTSTSGTAHDSDIRLPIAEKTSYANTSEIRGSCCS